MIPLLLLPADSDGCWLSLVHIIVKHCPCRLMQDAPVLCVSRVPYCIYSSVSKGSRLVICRSSIVVPRASSRSSKDRPFLPHVREDCSLVPRMYSSNTLLLSDAHHLIGCWVNAPSTVRIIHKPQIASVCFSMLQYAGFVFSTGSSSSSSIYHPRGKPRTKWVLGPKPST